MPAGKQVTDPKGNVTTTAITRCSTSLDYKRSDQVRSAGAYNPGGINQSHRSVISTATPTAITQSGLYKALRSDSVNKTLLLRQLLPPVSHDRAGKRQHS